MEKSYYNIVGFFSILHPVRAENLDSAAPKALGRLMLTTVTAYYLEMTDSDALRPKLVTNQSLTINQAHVPSPEFNRFLYTAVGGD